MTTKSKSSKTGKAEAPSSTEAAGTSTTLAQRLGNSGYCLCGAPLWEGGPPTATEFPLVCPECTRTSSLAEVLAR